MNETLTNLLQQNRAKKVGGKRGEGKKIPSGAVFHEKVPKEEQQPGSSRQCNNLVELSNHESSHKEENDGTNCKIFKKIWRDLTEKCGDWVQWNICDEYICPKCYDQGDISAEGDFFLLNLHRIININPLSVKITKW